MLAASPLPRSGVPDSRALAEPPPDFEILDVTTALYAMPSQVHSLNSLTTLLDKPTEGLPGSVFANAFLSANASTQAASATGAWQSVCTMRGGAGSSLPAQWKAGPPPGPTPLN